MSDTATLEQPPSTASWIAGLASAGDAPVADTPASAPNPPAAPAATPSPKPDAKPAAAPVAAEKGDEAWPRTADQWKKFRETKAEVVREKEALGLKLTEAEKRAKALEEEVGKLKATPPVPQDYDEVKKRASELDDRLKLVALEQHPQFKAYYDGKVNAAIEQAKQIVGSANADRIAKLLQLPDGEWRDEQLEQLTGDLPPLKQGRLASVIGSLSNLNAEKQAELSNYKARYDQLQSENAKREQDAAKNTEAFISSTLSTFRSDDSVAGVLDEAGVETAKRIALGGTKDPADALKVLARGVAYPKLLSAWIADKEKIATLEKQVAGLTAAAPRGTSPGGEPVAESALAPDGSAPMESTRHWMNDLRKAWGGTG